MTNTGADMHTITLEKGLATFINALTGKNRSAATLRAYQTDITQFIAFLHENNVSIHTRPSAKKRAKFQVERLKVPKLVKARAFYALILARVLALFPQAFSWFQAPLGAFEGAVRKVYFSHA